MILAQLSWPEIAPALSRVCVAPLGSLEQHGPHLPLWTDTAIVSEIARQVEQRLSEQVLLAPVQPIGYSPHHARFGCVSLDLRAYMGLIGDLCRSLAAMGFRRIFLLNGHGGNDVPAKQALFETRQRHRQRKDLLLLAIAYWTTTDEASKSHPGLRQTVMLHACEWETSMMLRLAPHLVKDHRHVTPQEPGKAFTASRGWIMPDRSEDGHVGDPREATADKGEALFQAFTRGTVELIGA